MNAELIARLEKAEEGSREFDFYVARAMGWHGSDDYRACSWLAHPDDRDGSDAHAHYLRYTTSLDAALTLVPEGWVVCSLRNGDMDQKYWDVRRFTRWVAMLGKIGLRVESPHEVLKFPNGKGPTAALALCIAALRARESKTND